MATNVTLNLKVNDNELDDLNKELNSVRNNINKVERASDDASNGLKKVGDNGGAISTLDAFTGGLATRIRDAAEASKLFSINLKGVQAALVATGIGAFVVALGLVVAYWDEIKGTVTGVNYELEEQIELQNEITKQANFQLELLEAGENSLRLQGKSEQEIIELKKQRINQILETTKAELEYQKQQLSSQIEAEKNARRIFENLSYYGNEFSKIITNGIDNLLSKLGIDIGLTEKAQSIRGSIFDSLFGNEEGIKERKDEIDSLTKAIVQQQDKLAAIELARRQGTKGESGDKVEVLPLTGLAGLDSLNETLAAEFNAISLMDTARTNLEEANSKFRIEQSNKEAMAKRQNLYEVADAFGSLGQAIGEQTALGKSLAISGALINTYLGITEVLSAESTLPEPFATISKIANTVAVGAAGFSAVKNIASVQIPGGNGGGVAVSGSASTPPAFNVVQSNPQNQLNQALLQKNNEPVEAFVVEKNVTTAQEMTRNKVNSSSL